MERRKRGLLIIAFLDLLALTIGIVGALGTKRFLGLVPAEEGKVLGPGFFAGGHLSFLSLAVAAVAVITFFGFLILERNTSAGGTFSEEGIRQAIAVAIVTVYLVLVGVVAFFGGKWESPEVTMTLLGSFTATVGVVVAFYFGASAYVEVRKSQDKKNGP